MKFRVAIIILGVVVIYSSLLFNLYNLQIENGKYYSARAESQYRLAGLLEPRRGNIYFTDKNRNLIPAAINKDYPIIFAVPKEIENLEETAKIISGILSLNDSQVRKVLSKPDDLYEVLLVKAAFAQVEEVKKANLAGVYIENQDFRFYPFESLASQALGFVGASNKDDEIKGRYGSELYFDKSLGGQPGKIEGEKVTNPIAGENLFLTIDRNIQARAEEILVNLIKDYKAVGGTVIVQEPQTGKILALGNYPSFSPNNYSQYPIKNFLNPAIEAIYEPGSVFKVITMASGIDSGKITPETSYYDSGSVTINDRTIKNWDLEKHGPYGKVTITNVLEYSINTGAVFAQRKIGQDIFYNYLLKFGFGELTGITLPGELKGLLDSLKNNFRDINFATASFGQGVSVTPLQLISAVGAIANDGLLMKPFIIESTKPQVVRRVISKEAADQVTAMMVSAVKKAVIAQIPNYTIAGKTGTAQVPDFVNGGYTDQVINTYVGFAPASDPKFIILIKIDKPEGAPLAGLTVVPAFRELANFVLNYYNIPPDSLIIE